MDYKLYNVQFSTLLSFILIITQNREFRYVQIMGGFEKVSEHTNIYDLTQNSGETLQGNLFGSWNFTKPENAFPNTGYAATAHGWMAADSFYSWFKKSFLNNCPNERSLLLVFDGHVSHIYPNKWDLTKPVPQIPECLKLLKVLLIPKIQKAEYNCNTTNLKN